jgi:pimeloyl-ACP methyl ester carboxylesterase
VVCPDVVGRGQSDWLADPSGYTVPTYLADMVTLIARLNVPQLDWVGTSMGGLIGMALAALPNTPVRKLVLNDVGPKVEHAFIQRLLGYLGQPVHWKTEQEAADALWAVSDGFGPHTPEEWFALTRPLLRADGDGFKLHYDPAIAAPIRAMTPEIAAAGEAMLWHFYDRITAPTLLLRGKDSDVLATDTAQAMVQRGPRARLHELAGVGHAPTLVAADQRAVLRDFLLSP